MTSFTTQMDIKSLTFSMTFDTDNEEYFEHMQMEARKCVDHEPLPIDVDMLLWDHPKLHPCHYAGGKLLHAGTWHPGRWYLWFDKFGNSEICRMKADAFDHFWPETKIIKEENVVAFKEVELKELKKTMSRAFRCDRCGGYGHELKDENRIELSGAWDPVNDTFKFDICNKCREEFCDFMGVHTLTDEVEEVGDEGTDDESPDELDVDYGTSSSSGTVKCSFCLGKGIVRVGYGIRGAEICKHCKGEGLIAITLP